MLDIEGTYAWHNMLRYTSITDVLTGLSKSVVFGAIIAIVGCYKGMFCGEGAEGVGKATTEAVVIASISILISNFFLTMFITQAISLL